jgi:hypothetical protein
MNRIDYNNRVFKTISNSESGEVSIETVFFYFHNLDLVTATYSGGKIAFGQIMAKVLQDDSLDMRYQHVNTSGEIMTGKCLSTPELLPNGKIRLHEKWQWTSGDLSSGESIVEEI